MDAILIEGLIELLLCTFLFGSAYVPIKRAGNYGDGIFSLQMRCISILCLGFGVYAWTGFVHFYPLALLGGCIWTLANMIVMPCISELGLGVACLLYNFSNCLVNWLNGNFGLFWTNARPASNNVLNYAGLICLLAGGMLITFIKPEKIPHKKLTVSTISSVESSIKPGESVLDTTSLTSGRSKINVRRIVAIFFSLFTGFLFGQDPTPVIIHQDRFDGPKSGLFYIFSFNFGIFISSSVVFVVYCIAKRGRPFVNPEIVIPSLVSGLIWAVAQGLFIICMGHLSITLAGPIASIVPGCIAACWSVFYFKEIKVSFRV
ncbi:hypothetical protein M3Y97_00783800 [Aphelenchoides bicaudatus]|nr:hypothetical protein M3Y97_00783800 [Aphelenchoides bicaudatus]